jgi:hypothetical protein
MINYEDEPELNPVSAAYAGARFLDIKAITDPEVVPVTWRDLLDRDTLDTATSLACPLAQINDPGTYDLDRSLNGYAVMCRKLGIDLSLDDDDDIAQQMVIRLGFAVQYGATPWTYADLTKAWLDMLRADDAADLVLT